MSETTCSFYRCGLRHALALCVLVLTACGARASQSTLPSETAAEPVELEPLRVEATERPGGYDFNIYDAGDLFDRGVAQSHAGECDEAIATYDQVLSQFPQSRFAPLSHYNAALCIKAQGDHAGAAARFERLLVEYPDSPDLRDARFQLLGLYVETESAEPFNAVAEVLLADEALIPDQRVEVMARQAEMLLLTGQRAEAATQARRTLAYARTRPADDQVADDYFLGTANYVYAETLRMEAEEVEITGSHAEQRDALNARAGVVTRAQHAYFDTMRVHDARWSAAAGFRIGEMYQLFWDDIMEAPVPAQNPPLSAADMEVFAEAYHHALASEIEPLLRHAVRYWELTLVMLDRTQAESEWRERIETSLAETRALLLDYQAASATPGEDDEGPEEASEVGAPRETEQDAD